MTRTLDPRRARFLVYPLGAALAVMAAVLMLALPAGGAPGAAATATLSTAAPTTLQVDSAA